MIRSNLLELLGRKRWSQAKLARVTGIRPTTISEFARDIAPSMTMSNIDLICEALDCQPGELMSFFPNEIPRIERNQQGEPIKPVED